MRFRIAVRVGCLRRAATRAPDEWPSRRQGLAPPPAQNPAYRPTGSFFVCNLRAAASVCQLFPDGCAFIPSSKRSSAKAACREVNRSCSLIQPRRPFRRSARGFSPGKGMKTVACGNFSAAGIANALSIKEGKYPTKRHRRRPRRKLFRLGAGVYSPSRNIINGAVSTPKCNKGA